MLPRAHETKVLIVDDEPLVLRTVARFLPEGVQCEAAGTVAEALSRIASSDPPHGLATDVYLPDGTGFDICNAWRAAYPEAPTVIFTGRHDVPEVVNRACGKNAHFLAKPFTADEFRVFTSAVLAARWRVADKIAERFAAFVSGHDLTVPQAELLARYERRLPHRQLAEELGISRSTLRTRIEQLSRKFGVETLDLVHERMMGR